MENNELGMRNVPVHGATNQGLPKVAQTVCKVPQTAKDEISAENWKRERRVRSQHAWFMREFAIPARRGELG
jgi:hypothetical protein